MSKQLSAGFLLRSKQLFLLCHITQNPEYKDKETDRNWSIPKGLVNPSETVVEAAFRELKEETSIDLKLHLKSFENIQPLPTIESNSKLYWIYFFDDMTGKLFQHKLKCTSLIENEYVPIRNGLPEHDKFKWVTKAEGKKLIFESLIPIFDSI